MSEPFPDELRAGYDSHQLRKSVNQMCEEADWPEVLNFVVAPTEPSAKLLTRLTRPGVSVVAPMDDAPREYVRFDNNGDYFATYVYEDIPWDETLDLRLAGEG